MNQANILPAFLASLYLLAGCTTPVHSGSANEPSASTAPHLKSLYDAHAWFELREKLVGNSPALYRGAVAAAFAQANKAEAILRPVINTAPQSNEAFRAYEILTHLYLQTGQFARLAADMSQRLKDFPASAELQHDHAALGPLLRLPDQVTMQTAFAVLQHDGGLFSPQTINGKPANYFFDTGAGVSSISESEAQRLGVTIDEDAGKMGTSTGHQTAFRTAVAKEFKWGGVELRNVSFIVFPDSMEPWRDLPKGRRGLVGMPILLAAQRLRWARDGTLEIGVNRPVPDGRKPNICFDADQPNAVLNYHGRDIWMVLDTGAVDTELWLKFADTFPDLIRSRGTKSSKDVRGIGHAEVVESVTLPDLPLMLSGREVHLHPAHVLMKQNGSKRCLGNLGMDLLKQAPAFEIDFRSMTLELQSGP